MIACDVAECEILNKVLGKNNRRFDPQGPLAKFSQTLPGGSRVPQGAFTKIPQTLPGVPGLQYFIGMHLDPQGAFAKFPQTPPARVKSPVVFLQDFALRSWNQGLEDSSSDPPLGRGRIFTTNPQEESTRGFAIPNRF